MNIDELDLDELKNFSFQPTWSQKQTYQFNRDGGNKKHRLKKDFRSANFKQNGRKGEFENRKKEHSIGKYKGHNRKNFTKHEFQPVIETEFYPDDAHFETIVNAFRLTCKTYELFSVARLFLEKPERYVVIIKKCNARNHSDFDQNLYLTSDDDLVFLDENSAVQHVLSHHFDKYFLVKEEEGREPKGTFVCIHKCGITGKILCPPNYHRYQEILLEHHEKYLSHVPFERFKNKIESVSDQTLIDEWKIDASKTLTYIPKLDECDEHLTKFSEVKRFFIKNFKEQAIKVSNSFRVPGSLFTNMPRGELSRSMFVLLNREKRFPLNFSNNLRGKLRRAHFTIYKVQSGKSKISCICAVKRKFRSTEDRFEEDIQVIIDFVDNHQNVRASELYKLMYPDAPEHVIGEKDEKFSTFAKNLNWLIHEGYISEFEDGRLVSTAIMSKEQIEAMKKSETSIDTTGGVTSTDNNDSSEGIVDTDLENTSVEVEQNVIINANDNISVEIDDDHLTDRDAFQEEK